MVEQSSHGRVSERLVIKSLPRMGVELPEEWQLRLTATPSGNGGSANELRASRHTKICCSELLSRCVS